MVGDSGGLEGVLGEHGVSTVHVAEHEAFSSYAPAAVARAALDVMGRTATSAVVAAGNERGNEVLAHVAAIADLPFAANCLEATAGDPALVTRVRWGGSLLEEARLHGSPALMTVQPHSVAPEAVAGEPARVERFAPELTEADLAVRVHERVGAATGGVSLADAKVVVSCGRGAGSPEGFGIIEELAGLLGGAVGCSRAVTMAGWRPHTDQVGQTGTKIAPDIYIACGISGATQHMAGCKGAKAILAVNTDPEAPILASADYAVIGDLHEVVPAISAELRKAGRLSTTASVASAVALVAAIAVAGFLFARRALFLARLVRSGKSVDRVSDVPRRVGNETAIVLGQKKLLQRLVPGLVHAFIFWGFLVLFPTIFMAVAAIVDRDEPLPAAAPLGWLESQGWYALLVDVFAVLVLIGVVVALGIRKIQRPRRFEGSHLGEADLILALIAGIVTTLLLWHATLIALELNPWPADWSPVSDALSGLFGGRHDDRGPRARLRLGRTC